MIPVRVSALADTIGAELVGDGSPLLTGVVIDSRQAGPGTVFVALPGEYADGHDYVEQAFQRGALAAVVTRAIGSGPNLVVDDPLAALGRIGRAAVDAAKAGGLRIVGITGSQGKTSTKDLLSAILETAAATVAPTGSLNNEIGVPLTAARIDSATRYLVSEMGARGVGHIAYLCGITPPDVSLVLNVGQAHLGEFGSREGIARAKSEIVQALSADGVAVLNADDPRVAAMAALAPAGVIRYSVRGDTDADLWTERIESDDLSRHRFVLCRRLAGDGGAAADVQRHQVTLQVIGRHQVENALAAAAAAVAFELPLERIAAALSRAGSRSRWRMELSERADGVVIINDAYNANPDSMAAALRTLAELGRARRHRFPRARTWAVLGEMLELGDGSTAEHDGIGSLAAGLGISRLVVIGENAKAIWTGAARSGLTGEDLVLVDDKAAALAVLSPQLAPGDLVLVKASRGIALETLAAALLGEAADREVPQS